MTYIEFKKRIRASGLTMSSLSIRMGMSRPTLQKRLQCPIKMTIEEADILSKQLGINVDSITE